MDNVGGNKRAREEEESRRKKAKLDGADIKLIFGSTDLNSGTQGLPESLTKPLGVPLSPSGGQITSFSESWSPGSSSPSTSAFWHNTPDWITTIDPPDASWSLAVKKAEEIPDEEFDRYVSALEAHTFIARGRTFETI